MDITDYYETHHLDRKKADAVLNKFYVCDETNPFTPAFIYSPDNLYGRCKAKVEKIFKTMESRQATPAMKLFCWSFVIYWIFTFVNAVKNPGIISSLLLGHACYVMLGIGHNSSHRGQAWGYCLDVTSYPQRVWNVTHCLSHHSFTNLERDLEITSFEPFIYFTTSQPENKAYVLVTQFIIFLLTPIMLVGQTISAFFTKKAKFQPEDLILPLEFVIGYYVSGSAGLSAVAGAHAFHAILVGLIAFPIHRTLDVWTDGDPNPTRDFGLHMLQTTGEHDRGTSILHSFLLFEGLTHHVAHHMFPTIDYSKLHLVTPIIEETCREMGIDYPNYDFSVLSSRYWGWLIRKKKPATD